jgi:hypothetical protein
LPPSKELVSNAHNLALKPVVQAHFSTKGRICHELSFVKRDKVLRLQETCGWDT